MSQNRDGELAYRTGLRQIPVKAWGRSPPDFPQRAMPCIASRRKLNSYRILPIPIKGINTDFLFDHADAVYTVNFGELVKNSIGSPGIGVDQGISDLTA